MRHDIDRLRAMWANHELTQNEIRRAMRMSPRTLTALVKRHGLPPRKRRFRSGQFVEIPVEEIYRRAAELRATWPESRLADGGGAWCPPRV